MTTLPPRVQQATMMAAMIHSPGDVRYEAVTMPQPGPGEIVVKVDTALTCGTDLKTYRRGHPVLIKSYPSGFGHECAGTVAAVGDGVTQFSEGDRVVAANSAPCMDCFFCHKGNYNLCEHLDLLNGTYAEYIKIPAPITQRNTLHVPDHVPLEAAAFCEPLSVSVRGVEACRIHPGDSVAVIGLGAIGQMLVRLAKLKGASVVGLGRNPLKRRMAETFGQADMVLDTSQMKDSQAIVSEFSPEGRGFDVVIEAVGQPATWEQAIQLVRRGGLVNLFGGCEGGTHISIETRRLHYDDITLISPFHHTPAFFRQALALIAEGDMDPTPLITHTMPMSQTVTALEKVAQGEALKVALKPSRKDC